jgi:hypothetical protein
MLTGRRLFQGETITEVLAAVLTQEPDLTAVPVRVRRLLERCLEKDPKKRLRDIGDAMSLVDPVAPPGRDVASGASVRPPAWQRVLGLGGWVAAAALAVALAVMAWSSPVADGGAAPPMVRFQIPRASGVYTQASTAFAVSPDGLSVVHYDAVAEGRYALFVRNFATGEVREVPGARVFNPRGHSLFWSPDSRQIVRGDFDNASVIDVLTGGVRRLCECRFTGGDWNREGVILLGSVPGSDQGILRVSVGDSTLVDITKVEGAGRGRDEWPRFLPDGRRFLFTRTTPGGNQDTYVGSLDGGATARLVNGSRRVFVPSGDGPRGYLLGIDPTGLVAQPFDADTATVTGEAVTVLADAVAVSAAPSLLVTSSAGTRLRTRPTWFTRNGVSAGTVGEGGFIESVVLSPDGRRVAVGHINTTS